MIDLKSLEPLTKEQNPWEVNKADDTSMSSLIALEMIGKFELEASDKKYVQRRIRVTLTSTTTTANGAASNGKSFKSTGESDEEDGKKPALSFCWTLDSFPKSGPATPLIANQAMITAIAPHKILRPLFSVLVAR
jgi:hypothetical protein